MKRDIRNIEEVDDGKVEVDQSKKLALLEEYKDVLYSEIPDILPPARKINHVPSRKDPNLVSNPKNIRIPRKWAEPTRRLMKRKIQAGWYQPSKSEDAVACFYVPKKDGSPREVFDMRDRNKNTVKDRNTLPDQESIVHAVANAKYKSKLDFLSAFPQMRIEPGYEHLTAFKTELGLLESRVMQMGDTNAGASWQRLMNSVFEEYIGVFMYAYLDDIFIYSDTEEEHFRHLRLVLNKCREEKFWLSEGKVDLFSANLDCLGRIIQGQEIRISPKKMSQVLAFKSFPDAKTLVAFNGLIGYLADHIPGLATHLPILQDAVTQDKFEMTESCQQAVKEIQMLCLKAEPLVSLDVSRLLDPKDPLRVMIMTDGSLYGLGGVILQGTSLDDAKPVAFHARKLTAAQSNYTIHEIEFLALVDLLKTYKHLLFGLKLNVFVDNAALTHFQTQKPGTLSPRQARWIECLGEFEIEICHIPGKDNKVADILSHLPTLSGVDKELLLDPVFNGYQDDEGRMSESYGQERAGYPESNRLEADSSLHRDPASRTLEDEDILRMEMEEYWTPFIQRGYLTDTTFGKVVDNPEHYSNFRMEEGLLYLNPEGKVGLRRLCVPNVVDEEGRRLREELLSSVHDEFGHFGQGKTLASLARWYYWPRMVEDTEAYVSSCESCQLYKSTEKGMKGLLHPLELPSKPYESIGMDFLGPLPKIKGMEKVLVIVDRFSNYVNLVPVSKSMSSKELVKVMIDTIWRAHSPKSIVSDRDTIFTSEFTSELWRRLGIDAKTATAYHKETDGSTEHMIQTLNVKLAQLLDGSKNWLEVLPVAERTLNQIQQSNRGGLSAYEILYGIPSEPLRSIGIKSKLRDVESHVEELRRVQQICHEHLVESKVSQTHFANRHRKVETFKRGDLVLLSTEDLEIKGVERFTPKWVGPFKVITATDKSRVTLQLHGTWRRLFNEFHASKLKLWRSNDPERFPSRQLEEPDAVATDRAGEPLWEVEDILDIRVLPKGGRRFLVKWRGYGSSANSWEPEKHMITMVGEVNKAIDRINRVLGTSHHRMSTEKNIIKDHNDD